MPYGMKVRTLVGKDPEDIKCWKVYFFTGCHYPHYCCMLAQGMLFLKMHGSEDDEIVFEREKVWGLGAIPNGDKKLSYYVQVEDTSALCMLLGVESMKKTHGFRYACIKHLASLRVPQERIDKLVGWASKMSTGSRVYDHDGCPGKTYSKSNRHSEPENQFCKRCRLRYGRSREWPDPTSDVLQ